MQKEYAVPQMEIVSFAVREAVAYDENVKDANDVTPSVDPSADVNP